MNSGTWISAPVSTVAGFVPALERSPCSPGSVWVTSSLDGHRQLDVERRPVVEGHLHRQALQQEARVVSDQRLRQVVLLVVLAVHEHEVRAVLVQIGGVAAVDGRGLDLDPGVERLVDDLARQHVLQLGAHERGALARLDVLELDDGPQLAIDLQDESVLEVGGRCHGGTTPSLSTEEWPVPWGTG